jgi:hypothetical protein
VIEYVPLAVGDNRVTGEESDLVESASETALTDTGETTLEGAVYNPVADMLPAPLEGLTVQLTWVFVEPETVAVNC